MYNSEGFSICTKSYNHYHLFQNIFLINSVCNFYVFLCPISHVNSWEQGVHIKHLVLSKSSYSFMYWVRGKVNESLETSIAGLMKQAPCWEGPCSRDWQAASNQQPVRSRGPQSYNCKEVNSANNLSELGRRFFPSRVYRWEHSSGNILIAAWWDPEEDSAKPSGTVTHRNCEISVCCFKLLSLW